MYRYKEHLSNEDSTSDQHLTLSHHQETISSAESTISQAEQMVIDVQSREHLHHSLALCRALNLPVRTWQLLSHPTYPTVVAL